MTQECVFVPSPPPVFNKAIDLDQKIQQGRSPWIPFNSNFIFLKSLIVIFWSAQLKT